MFLTAVGVVMCARADMNSTWQPAHVWKLIAASRIEMRQNVSRWHCVISFPLLAAGSNDDSVTKDQIRKI